MHQTVTQYIFPHTSQMVQEPEALAQAGFTGHVFGGDGPAGIGLLKN